MTVLIALLTLAIVLACGAMLAPALPTRKPRIALAGVLAFALVADAGVGAASAFGFSPALYDALILLALATSALAWRRSGFKLPALPGWLALGLLGVLLLVYLAPTVLIPVPLDTDAQGFGYLALMVREGGTLDTLAPFHPEVQYLYSPGFPALAAYTSARTGAGLHLVQMGLGAALAFLFAWLAYDFGCELGAQDKRLSGALTLAMAALGTGLFTAYMDSHYTTLTAFVFALAFVTFAVRYIRETRIFDAAAGAVCLAAVPLSHPDTTVILAIGYVPFLLTVWLARPRPSMRAWLGLAVFIPAGGVLIVTPWLLNLARLLRSDIASPFETSLSHLGIMAGMSGLLVPALAAGGVVIALRRRGAVDVWMLTWLAAVVEFGAFGLLRRAFPFLEDTLLKYDYPFSIAWHGPVIPFLYLGALAAAWLLHKAGRARVAGWARRWGPAALALAAIAVLLGAALAPRLLPHTKGRLSFFGAFSSHADVEAMLWLKANAPPGARVLNYPTNHEAEWAPVIAERDTIFYRPQPFFQGTADSEIEQMRLRAFWEDPANPLWAQVFQVHRVSYVLVPQAIANPAALETMYRWRAPYTVDAASSPADAPYLELVFDRAGAQVYALRTP